MINNPELKTPIKLTFDINNTNYEITTKYIIYIIYIIDFGQSSFDRNKGRLINDIEFISTIYKKFILEIIIHEKNFLKYIKQTNEIKNKSNFANRKKDFIDNNLLNTKECEEKYKNMISYDILHFFGTLDKTNLSASIIRTFDKIQSSN